MEKLTPTTRAILLERFGCDSVYALATVDGMCPAVRNVNGYYEDGVLYVITDARSNKRRQIAGNPAAALAGDWFTASGIGENRGAFLLAENAEIADRLRTVFSEWLDNGHSNLSDPNTVILAIRLEHGVLFHHGTRYEIDFTA